jgi:hypothetical protein
MISSRATENVWKVDGFFNQMMIKSLERSTYTEVICCRAVSARAARDPHEVTTGVKLERILFGWVPQSHIGIIYPAGNLSFRYD